MTHGVNKVFKLFGNLQHYAWGGDSFLSQWLHLDNPDQKPVAEYWLGAHDNASSELLCNDEKIKLNAYISSHPQATLGEYVNNRFRRLPYLLKILDVKDMLSIQVHPSKEIAEAEFYKENKKLIPIGALHRNYKDDNHKPELMLALGDFWLLHGFKSKEEIINILNEVPEMNFLLPIFGRENYYELYKTVMELDQDIVNEVLQPLLDRIVPKYLGNAYKKENENFWAARAALTYNEPGKIDRGIFSIYLFNLVNVPAGKAVFQGAGLPHAYLEGQNVEIMANSDNVLRGGLTPKHVDVDELLKHIKFEATIPKILQGQETAQHVQSFITPAEDFQLSVIQIASHDNFVHTADSVEILIIYYGTVRITEGSCTPMVLRGGESFVAFDRAEFEIAADTETLLYRATVPRPEMKYG